MTENIVDTVETQEAAAEKTFTQAEVDVIVNKRLARAMKGMPDEGELSAYRSWRENQQAEQQAEQQRFTALTEERDTARGRVAALEAEIEQLKRSNYIQSKGYTGEDAEFVAFKAAKMVTDKMTFEQAVDSITSERVSRPVIDWTARVGGAPAAPNENQTMNALIRGARK